MLNKLQQAEDKYLHLEASLADPVVAGDPARCAQIAKEYKSLTPIIEKYRAFKSAQARIDDALSLLEEGDDELRALA
ncbi:MAG: PCRF domain-containing protein, partial [Ruminococcaceae bacterium]|nr:PCRF domain-containing protein [Oscillospiraceae bacterium]